MVNKIEIISTTKVENSVGLYKIVDVCNRTLKNQGLMFGLALEKEDKSKRYFSFTVLRYEN